MIRFVAEIGSMHEGSPALACEMARLAKWAGADIFKMQLGWPKDVPVLHVSYEFAGAVADYCRLIGIEFMASIWSEAGLDIGQSGGVKRVKIGHQMGDAAPVVPSLLRLQRPHPRHRNLPAGCCARGTLHREALHTQQGSDIGAR